MGLALLTAALGALLGGVAAQACLPQALFDVPSGEGGLRLVGLQKLTAQPAT
jgi:hypothetical protein